MREILFRAKRIDNGEWVEGEIITADDATFIAPSSGELYFVQKYDFRECSDLYEIALAEVIPSTVGQFTDLTDKNGKKIFEGDIVFGYARVFKSVVKWNSEQAGWSPFGDERTSFYADESEIIGNIHEEVTK